MLTTFEQIWTLPQAEQQRSYPVRFEYVVYYYDRLWQAMWGRSGEACSYLSLGAQEFPIKPGCKILVEGTMRPARGMVVEDPKVTVLTESAPLDELPTRGDVADTERFNKRYVSMEGYVDRQSMRDANHVELAMIAGGRSVLLQLLVGGDAKAPDFRDRFIRAKGVYFARSSEASGAPQIELWVQQASDIEVQGTLDRDPRFDLPRTELGSLGGKPADALIRVRGRVRSREAGKSLTLEDETGAAVLHTMQSEVVHLNTEVDAVGYPAREGGGWVLRNGLFRDAQNVVTTVSQIWSMPESERGKRHRARIEFLVYYYDPDPAWRAMWGRAGSSDDYLSLGAESFAIKPWQRILIEGSIVPSAGAVIEDPKVTVLEEGVPVEAMPTDGRIADAEQFNKHVVTTEGIVDRQVSDADGQHVRLEVVVENRLVTARLLFVRGTKVPNWEGARVRLKGVYSATADPTGGPPNIEIWVAGAENLQVLGWLGEDPRFTMPAMPIDQLGNVPEGKAVRVVGIVRAQQPGKSLLVRDDTGQIELHTAQARPMPIGSPVEVVGKVLREGRAVALRDALYRASRVALPAPAGELKEIRLADQLRELTPDEAARSHPVRLSGVITWARPNTDFFFMQDGSGGACVYRPPGDKTASFFAGRRIDVTGVSASGKFTPVVLATSLNLLASIDLPEPRQVTPEQALTGVEEAQWVSMSGYVRAVTADGPWTRLDVTTATGEFQAMLPPNDRWPALAGAVVRLRGVCSAITNNRRQLTGIRLWVGSPRFVEIEEAAPADPFEAPARTIASLRQFSSQLAFDHRVRVTGVVVHQDPGEVVHLQEGGEALLVLSKEKTPLLPGDRVEAVGFPIRVHNRVGLREAVYRRIALGAEPPALRVQSLGEVDPELDGRLVEVEADLLAFNEHERGMELVLQNGDTIFEAPLGIPLSRMPADWQPGSRLLLKGVYVVEFDEYRRPDGVVLQLRSPHDVHIVARPPWWTVGRVLLVTGIVAMIGALGLFWAVVLRRRVREQNVVIRDHSEKEKAARMEAALARASKLESLGVLAGGIAHDFNNLLTVITGNISLARSDGQIPPESRRCLAESERAAVRARDLTQQLLTFAKGGDPVRAATRLEDVVREAAQFALHGAKARCEFDVGPDLWPAEVDRGQISRVVHNIIINANQAMPQGGVIRIALRNEEVKAQRTGLAAGRYVRLAFSDTGSGISAKNLPRIFEPYFTTKEQGSGLGLATVYSIVKKHDGHVEATSQPGRGTTFVVWLPASAKTLPDVTTSAEIDTRVPMKSARVLVMDDEAPIRLLASAVLKKMGFTVTAVDNGAQAVDAYAAAKSDGRPFDLVVLDLTVPGAMGGAEAMEKIHGMDPEVRAVVSSGYSSDPVMANYRAHGFRARAPKPYTASEFSNVIGAVMRNGGVA